ncbi:MAG TPA: hypothetical protein VKD43_18430 [Xanthobacteraceae bacterium]|nr:hypothetical protein [Xanthobacteraceae bacterium]
MLNRTTILILAAAIGAASLVSSTAFAKGNQGVGNQGVGLSGKGPGKGIGNGGGSVGKLKPGVTPIKPGIGKVTWPRWPHWHRHHHHRHWIPYPVIVGGGTTAYAATTTVRTAPCNCLTKEYLPDGGVLFKDLCTKEMAVSPSSISQAQSQ